MRKIILFIIIFTLPTSIISHDLDDHRLLNIYIDENGTERYEYPKYNNINNKLIINKDKYKYSFNKNMTEKEIDIIINNKNAWAPCENLTCVHGFCFLMVERYRDNWAYCECDKGYYGKFCQYTYGESLKINLNSSFSIDIEKRRVLDKIKDFFKYNIIPETIAEIYEVISYAQNAIDYYTNPIQSLIKNTFGEIFSKTVKQLLLLTPLKKYDGIINFFGSLANVIIDLFSRRLRNLEETQE